MTVQSPGVRLRAYGFLLVFYSDHTVFQLRAWTDRRTVGSQHCLVTPIVGCGHNEMIFFVAALFLPSCHAEYLLPILFYSIYSWLINDKI